ncbi:MULTISPECIES: acyltransferase [unclassified Caulobacter]|uniref:acyltransferase family protein n=1 Tax=unclassified Caulobacter TaxID=2648921 RepID=UPI0013747992|nr:MULTISPECIES: acyltransferase [unclassified Caulobacter]MBQ1561233.1 acyltransferase [Caulobacter sp.]
MAWPPRATSASTSSSSCRVSSSATSIRGPGPSDGSTTAPSFGRAWRVYPVHLVTLAATIAIWLAALKLGVRFDPQAFDPRMLPQHLLLVHAWGTTPTVQWNFPSWSISAEWFAYLGFPVAAIASVSLRRWPRLFVLAVLALFVAMFLTAQGRGVLFTDMSAQIGALRIIPAFLMGAALHRLGSSLSLPAGMAGFGALAATVWVAIAANLRLSDLYIWPGLAMLIFCLAETSKAAKPGAMSAPALVYLGEVSYSLYMVHLPADIVYFHALERLAPDLSGAGIALAWAGAFVACQLAAMVAYHLVERPARNWLRARDPFARRPTPEPAHEPVL